MPSGGYGFAEFGAGGTDFAKQLGGIGFIFNDFV
jgi:hypothetical protein